jgi:hypothetical protein
MVGLTRWAEHTANSSRTAERVLELVTTIALEPG